MDRRFFMTGSAVALLVAPGFSARASAQDDFISDDLPDYASMLGPEGFSPQGLAAPLPREVAMARDIMAQAPRTTPHEIMAWLASMREANRDGERYNEGWRERWNPLIVGFFAGTGLTPSGDQTPWCAACLNWCIERAGLKGTGSASSGSFRNPGGPSQPHLGDVAVFRDVVRGQGRGHVGFYVGGDTRQISVLGANQMNERGHHGICRKPYATRSANLVLDSFHPIAAGGRGAKRPAPRSEDPPPRSDDRPPRVRERPVQPPRGGGDDGGIGRW